ncbi:ABC transporter ATP-binding protein [Meiothermus granaticius]|uniref:Fe(3+) dicitrate transport ATP-binding protein FecE n=1 Tax=Meiothermus granaticius NBRC 107808 TaxID=1227551 RepID=A0A399F910_9DEIN|nr:ABC transporter ATP-binding protein [Meiothermus granaticius]RIH92620.1 Fe(3+) dicitrate transport ATP-binding protein FecE [Meiothermus granaticius NBRC 107808]GEM87962.1 iron ABC transporter ATP-binding protein [Meiothermus granaticius NBRC 107808]
MLELSDLTVGHRGRAVLRSINLRLESGQVAVLLGPNGSGKTTLIRTLLGHLPPLWGQVWLGRQPLREWSRVALARTLAYVPQAHQGLFAFTVEEVVLMGRTAHLGVFALPSQADRRIAQAALEQMGIPHLAEKPYTEVSGGERQLALLARALAQEAQVLVLDEPTSNLDFGNQLRVLAQLEALRDQGKAVFLSTHQPEHARRVADQVLLVGEGSVLGQGSPQTWLTPENLGRLYRVEPQHIEAYLGNFR